MVISCSAFGCTNRHTKERKLLFHRFPLDNPELLKKWVIAVRRVSWLPTKHSRICGDHFTTDSYKSDAKRYLKDDAVPSIFNFRGRGHLKKKFQSRRVMTKHRLPNDLKQTKNKKNPGPFCVKKENVEACTTENNDLMQTKNKKIPGPFCISIESVETCTTEIFEECVSPENEMASEEDKRLFLQEIERLMEFDIDKRTLSCFAKSLSRIRTQEQWNEALVWMTAVLGDDEQKAKLMFG